MLPVCKANDEFIGMPEEAAVDVLADALVPVDDEPLDELEALEEPEVVELLEEPDAEEPVAPVELEVGTVGWKVSLAAPKPMFAA